jgi:hypothetical protein
MLYVDSQNTAARPRLGKSFRTRRDRSALVVHAALLIGASLFQLSCDEPVCPTGTTEISGHCVRNDQSMVGQETSATGANVPTSTGASCEPTAGTGATSGSGVSVSTQPPAGIGGSGLAGTGSGGTVSTASAGTQANAAAGAASDPMMSAGPVTGGASGSSSANAGASGGNATVACTPSAETCDGVDNDCDGKVDEEIEPRLCGNSVPPCKQGTQACVNGTWSTDCVGAVKPTPEICDGIDNDCDGTPDPGCVCTNGATMECGIGVAPCGKGMRTCMNGVWGTDCPGEVKGSAEKCDGVDNDCNGTKDDGGDSLCPGQRCGGSSGCVECLSDTDCNNRSAPTCKVNYCDASRHVCSTKNSNNSTSCGGGRTCNAGQCVACSNANDCDDRTCQNKACTGGECVYTSVPPGDSHSTCSSGKVCSASRSCVECVDSAQCASKGSGYQCTDGQCKSSCGNNQLDRDSGEECEASLLTAVTKRYCNASTCKFSGSVFTCKDSEGPGCSPRCDTTADCPTPRNSETVACASNSNGSWCQYACSNSDADCPPGGHCATFICFGN